MKRLPLWLALALAGVAAAEAWWPRGGPPPAAPPPPAPVGRATAPVPTAERPPDPVPVLLDRPLFTPGRRPPGVAPPAVAEAASVPLPPRLIGVLVDGTSRRAILVPASGGKPVAVAEGARVDAFAVERIEPGQVTLVGPGGTRVLRPTFGPPPIPPAAEAAADPPLGGPGAPGRIGSPPASAGPMPGLAGPASPPAAAR